jgi:Phage tail tube protein
MSRLLALVDDPTAGGSTLDVLETLAIPAPTLFVPVSTAQVESNLNQLDRKDEVRGRRADTAPISFASAPAATFESRAYPKIARPVLRKALGSAITSTGVSPEPISSTVSPLQSGDLPAFIMWLLREEQLDRLTGAVVKEFAFKFPVESEGTLSVTLDGLYQDVDASGAAEDPNGSAAKAIGTADYTGFEDTFMLRDATAFRGPGEGVEIPDLAGFNLTFNNGLIEDFRSRFRPNHNIEVVTIDEIEHKLWYPNRHVLGAQSVTGTVELSQVDVDSETKRLLTHAEKLVFEIAAGPLGTTPAADEMMRITLYKHAPTGGGAEPLVREGDQVSSYDFTAYLDEGTNKDIEATFVGATALT